MEIGNCCDVTQRVKHCARTTYTRSNANLNLKFEFELICKENKEMATIITQKTIDFTQLTGNGGGI